MKRILLSVRSLRFLPLAILGLAASLSPVTVGAAPVCQTGSLQSYIDLDTAGGCSIGQITFFRFSNLGVVSVGNPPTANASTITVTPISGSGGSGFSLSAVQDGTNYFSIPNPTSAESVVYSLNYSLDPLFGDLGLDPPVGNVTATQNYCISDVFSDACARGRTATQTVTTLSPNSTITLAPSPTFVDVDLSITLLASPGNPAGFDALNIFYGITNDATGIPEPGSSLLMGLGCVMLVALPVARRLRTR